MHEASRVRLGSKKIAELGAAPEGTWFSIDRGRDPFNQYVGLIASGYSWTQPVIQIWNMLGQEQQIYYTKEPYDNPNQQGRPKLFNYPPPSSTYLMAKPNELYDPNSDRNQYKKSSMISKYLMETVRYLSSMIK
jgi:hypothetical protein